MHMGHVAFLGALGLPPQDPFVETFTTAGTHQWESPVTGFVELRLWAGGGKGGTRTTGGSGGGGGGGAFSRVYEFFVVKGQTYSLTVGAQAGDTTWNHDYDDGSTIAHPRAKGGASVPNNTSTPGQGGPASQGHGDQKLSGQDGSGRDGGNAANTSEGGGGGGSGAHTSFTNSGDNGDPYGGGGGGGYRGFSGTGNGGAGAVGGLEIHFAGTL